MDDESGDNERDGLTSGSGGEQRQDWRGWQNESGSWFQRRGDAYLQQSVRRCLMRCRPWVLDGDARTTAIFVCCKTNCWHKHVWWHTDMTDTLSWRQYHLTPISVITSYQSQTHSSRFQRRRRRTYLRCLYLGGCWNANLC